MKRKYIRIALSDDDLNAFIKAKDEVENISGITLSESLFALSLIRKAIHKRS